MPTILITGASRGLGLEFARQYADAGWRIHASCRHPDAAGDLEAFAAGAPDQVTVHRLDVADAGRVTALAAALAGEPIDVLLNNAGVYGGKRKPFGETDYATWQQTLDINVLGPMRVAEAFADHVARSERRLIVCISSRMGSMAENTSGGAYIYRSSKAALNAVVKSLAVDLKERGITVVCFHPGWVATDMGGPDAPLKVPESVGGMRAVIERLTAADGGRFL
ncbi:MAG: SDR family oxidoreductase, partial [Alphaproteobacteria bacterium]